MSDLHICFECQEILRPDQLLEPAWLKALPREQQAITTPEVGCPGCYGTEVYLLADLREMVGEQS